MFNTLITGFGIVFTPSTFVLILFGTVVGVIFGSLPGVSASMAVALALPFAYPLDGVTAIAFLCSVYCASITGGGITAILFKIPGTPSNAPTTFDGFPMAQRGDAGKALGYSLIASAFGGLVSAFAMALVAVPLAKAALKFGPGELFAVSMLGLSVLTCLDNGNITKTLISGLLGLFLATIGMDPQGGIARFSFGNSTLLSGVSMIPVMIGLFAVTEVLKQTVKRGDNKENPGKEMTGDKKYKSDVPSLLDFWKMKWIMIRTSILGTIVGILPGAGATIASFLSYTMEKKISKHSEDFGTGIPDGIVASECSNNAATGGAMVPLLALGIPGGNAAAIMMSALVVKGVQVGPLLMTTQPRYLASTFASMFVTDILMIFVALLIAKAFAKILSIPYSILGPVIVILAILGSYALKNSTGDVVLMMGAGILGFLFVKLGYSSAALVLGLVLGDMCESNLRRAYQIAQGSWGKALGSPITIVLLLACAAMIIYPIISKVLKKEKA